MSAYPHGFAPPAPPPQPPELPEGTDPRPRWPAWYGPVALLLAFGVTVFAVIVLSVIAAIGGADVDHPGTALTVIGTLIQDAMLVIVAVWFASRVRRPRAWHFGLRRTRLWPAVGWAAAGLGAFYAFAAAYQALFHPHGEQSVTRDLGADKGTFALIVAAVLVVVVAPIAEETFFRGFFYRALRSRLGVIAAALLDGLVFGAIHYSGHKTLSVLPILAVLGFVFCLVYERTGSIYPTIGLHAFNNSIAYGASTHHGAGVAAVLGVAMLSACVLAPRFVATRAPALR